MTSATILSDLAAAAGPLGGQTPSVATDHPELAGWSLCESPRSGRVAVAVQGENLASLLADWRYPQLVNGYPYTLADYQQAMLAAIDLHTTQLLAAGFAYTPSGQQTAYSFALDTASLPIWQGLLTAAQSSLLTYPQSVGTVSNTLASLSSAADVQAFYAAGLARAQAILTGAVQLKASVQAATTTAALDAITDPRS